MSIRLMTKVFESSIPATAKFVLLAMADYASDSGESIFPSVPTLAHKTSFSERTVQDAIKYLLESGWLEIVSPGGGRGSTNVYRIRCDKFGDKNGADGSIKGERGSEKGAPASPDSSLTINQTNTVKPISQTPSRSAEDVKQMTLNALVTGVQEHAQRQTDEIGHFPQDTLEVIRRVCEIWRLSPPRSSKDSRYAYWIRGARELREACGEFGLGILDEIQEQWLVTGFLPSSPESLVKTATALAGSHRVGEHALVVDRPEELSYHWNSEISPEENERLMKQARERAKSTQETSNDNISQDKMA